MADALGGIVSGVSSIFGANEQVKGQKVAQGMYQNQKDGHQYKHPSS